MKTELYLTPITQQDRLFFMRGYVLAAMALTPLRLYDAINNVKQIYPIKPQHKKYEFISSQGLKYSVEFKNNYYYLSSLENITLYLSLYEFVHFLGLDDCIIQELLELKKFPILDSEDIPDSMLFEADINIG